MDKSVTKSVQLLVEILDNTTTTNQYMYLHALWESQVLSKRSQQVNAN